MNELIVSSIRNFNRFYLNKFGLLNQHILKSSFSLVEARVLLEIGINENCTASRLMEILWIDRGYLSRILKKFEKQKLINREVVEQDNRAKILVLTSSGKKVLEKLNQLSGEQVNSLISHLSKEQRQLVVNSMQNIQSALSTKEEISEFISYRSTVKPGDIGYVVYLHGVIYARECGYNHEFEGYVAESLYKFAEKYNSEKDLLLFAECGGRPIGVIGIVNQGSEAQLRWFLVLPEFRKLGIGKQLLRQALNFCRRKAYKQVFLYTTSDQQSAIRMYKENGFIKATQRSRNAWGKQGVEERYELKIN